MNSGTKPTVRSVCLFCASSSQVPRHYLDFAAEVGCLVAQQGVRLVYGGAKNGLMGAAADAALNEDGEVVGVMPKVLSGQERAHQRLSALHITGDMHERQKKMAELADAFVVLPGGLGTLAEFFEILTWKQIGLHAKPIALLNAYGFWNPLLGALERCHTEGFLHENPDKLFIILEQIEDFRKFLVRI